MKKFDNNKKKTNEKPDPSPVAVLLKDLLVAQIEDFLGYPDDQKADIIGDVLFNVGAYPANITGCEGAENYEVYQLERSTRMRREDTTKHGRLSTSIILLNKETRMPSFFAQAVIMPNDNAMITVYTLDEKGTDYRRTVKWGNRIDK